MFVMFVGASCGRSQQPDLVTAPKVGDRSSGTTEVTATLTSPQRHIMTNVNAATTETLALDDTGTYPTRTRVIITRDDKTMDGIAQPKMLGTFELEEKAGELQVSRVGGTVTPAERSYFTNSWHDSTTKAAAGRLLRRAFKVGEVVELSPDEIAGLGLGATKIELTVERVTSTDVWFASKLVGEVPGFGTLRAHGPLRFFAGGHEWTQDGDIFKGTEVIGSMHLSQHRQAL